MDTKSSPQHSLDASAGTKLDVEHRILLAARAEFAQFGLAGARVDRIAKAANTSKERLYAHFDDKVALFQSVLTLNGEEFFAAVNLTSDGVLDFVGQVFDHSTDYPEHLRILTWARLEGYDDLHPGVAAPPDKVAAIRAGQELGHIDTHWDPEDLLALLFGIALASSLTPGALNRTHTATARDAALEAARRLIEPR